jgi:hypothetical protein
MNVFAPAGSSPAKLDSTDRDAVVAWHDKVMEAGHREGKHYSPHALRYFVANYHFDRGTPEYDEVCAVLVDIYAAQAIEDFDEEESEEE